MFTVGIFTTHLPYLAFLFMYLLFFLFGTSNASSDDISFGEKTSVVEASYTTNHELTGSDAINGTSDLSFFLFKERKWCFSTGLKVKHSLLKTLPVLPSEHFPACFSRPPPIW